MCIMVEDYMICLFIKTNMWTQITQPWGFMRIARMFVGAYAFVEAYRTSDTLIAVMGLVLVGMAVFNMGCGAQGCGIPATKKITDGTEDVEFEEVRSK